MRHHFQAKVQQRKSKSVHSKHNSKRKQQLSFSQKFCIGLFLLQVYSTDYCVSAVCEARVTCKQSEKSGLVANIADTLAIMNTIKTKSDWKRATDQFLSSPGTLDTSNLNVRKPPTSFGCNFPLEDII